MVFISIDHLRVSRDSRGALDSGSFFFQVFIDEVSHDTFPGWRVPVSNENSILLQGVSVNYSDELASPVFTD